MNITSYHNISSTMHIYSEPMATDPDAGEPVNQINELSTNVYFQE